MCYHGNQSSQYFFRGASTNQVPLLQGVLPWQCDNRQPPSPVDLTLRENFFPKLCSRTPEWIVSNSSHHEKWDGSLKKLASEDYNKAHHNLRQSSTKALETALRVSVGHKKITSAAENFTFIYLCVQFSCQ